MGVSAAARDPPTAAAAVQRVAEESEELGRILRIEARPLKQAVGGSCGEASAPELDLIIIKDPACLGSIPQLLDYCCLGQTLTQA